MSQRGAATLATALTDGWYSRSRDTHFDQVLVLLSVPLQTQAPQQVLLASFNQLIENVEVPLAVVLVDHARLLQQVVDDVASHGCALPPRQRPRRAGCGCGGGRGEGGGEGEAGVLRCDAGSVQHAGVQHRFLKRLSSEPVALFRGVYSGLRTHLEVELDVHVLPETARVVVAQRLGIAEGLVEEEVEEKKKITRRR